MWYDLHKRYRVWSELFEQLFSNPQVTQNPQQLSIYEILVLSNQTLILSIGACKNKSQIILCTVVPKILSSQSSNVFIELYTILSWSRIRRKAQSNCPVEVTKQKSLNDVPETKSIRFLSLSSSIYHNAHTKSVS